MISGIGTTRRSAAADHHGGNWGKTGHAPPPAPIASGALGPIANRRSNLLWCTTRLFQQCGRMWSAALNTSLAVIRRKPRPDSPTGFEISVIMLKSEQLPHEAPNPVSKKAPRVHHAARRCGGSSMTVRVNAQSNLSHEDSRMALALARRDTDVTNANAPGGIAWINPVEGQRCPFWTLLLWRTAYCEGVRQEHFALKRRVRFRRHVVAVVDTLD